MVPLFLTFAPLLGPIRLKISSLVGRCLLTLSLLGTWQGWGLGSVAGRDPSREPCMKGESHVTSLHE